jgi:SAM-dependent methyltransferase
MSLSGQGPALHSGEAQIKSQIQRRYAEVAATGFDGGGAPDRVQAAGYPASFLDGLPGTVRDSYCGCGNPLEGQDLTGVGVVVDLGCGAGLDTRQAVWLLPSASMVVGLDLTPGMLALAAGPVRAVAGDMERLPLADDVADLVLANASFNLALDKPGAFAEALRILKPGGRLVARDLIREREIPREILEDPLACNTSLGGVLEERELQNTLETVGFSHVCISGHRAFPPVVSIKLEAVNPG